MKVQGGYTFDRMIGRIDYWTCGHQFSNVVNVSPPVHCPTCAKMSDAELKAFFAKKKVQIEDYTGHT